MFLIRHSEIPVINYKIFPFRKEYEVRGVLGNKYFLLDSEESISKMISKDLEYIKVGMPEGYEINGVSEKNNTLFYKDSLNDVTCLNSFEITDQKLYLTGSDHCFSGDLKHLPNE